MPKIGDRVIAFSEDLPNGGPAPGVVVEHHPYYPKFFRVNWDEPIICWGSTLRRSWCERFLPPLSPLEDRIFNYCRRERGSASA